MSVEASSWAFAQQDLSSGAKLLLVAIANRADKAGVCFPGRESLSEDCCCRPETVTANMKALEAARLIARFDRRRKNGSRTSDWLVLAPEAAERGPMVDADADELPAIIARVAVQTSGEDSQGDHFSPEVSGLGHLRNSGGPPEPSEEPPTDEGAKAPSSEGDEAKASSPPHSPLLAEFEDWLDHHERTTGMSPPRSGTAAKRARLAEFAARRREGYPLEDLKLATFGAWHDDFRRANGHYGHQSVLRRTKIDGLIAKGRRHSTGNADLERRMRAEQERRLREAQQ